MIDSIPIVRKRGQTSTIQIAFTSAGAALPLSGTVELAVWEQSSPISTDTPILELTGTLVEGGAGGIVQFTPDAADVDFVGSYFYGVTMTPTGGGTRPLLDGEWIQEESRVKP